MIEDHGARVKSGVRIGEVRVVNRRAREFGFDEVFQVITKKPEAASEREWKINVVEKFVAGEERLELIPGIAEEGGGRCVRRGQFATRAIRAEREKRVRDQKRVAGFRRREE